MNHNMKRELIIIVYKIYVQNMSRAQTEQSLSNLMESISLSNDEELKENYIIREIMLPINDGETNVEIIYPVAGNSLSIESYDTINQINKIIKDIHYDEINPYWNKLLRELKLRLIENEHE